MTESAPQTAPLETEADLAPIASLALVSGAADGGKIRASGRVDLDKHGAIFPEKMPKERWYEMGRTLHHFKKASNLILADWLRYGTREYGPQFVEEAAEQLGFSFLERDEAVRMLCVRRELQLLSLNSVHYAVVSELEDQDEREKWLNSAVEHKLSPTELRDSIAAGKVIKWNPETSSKAKQGGIQTIHSLSIQAERWFKKVEEKEPLENWPIDHLNEIEKQLAPFDTILSQVREAKKKKAAL